MSSLKWLLCISFQAFLGTAKELQLGSAKWKWLLVGAFLKTAGSKTRRRQTANNVLVGAFLKTAGSKTRRRQTANNVLVGALFTGSESAQSKPPEVHSSSQNGQLAQMERLGVSVDSDRLSSEHRGSR